MLEPIAEKQFKKDYKKALKRGLDKKLLRETVEYLVQEKQLPEKYRDHALTGNYKGARECHIQPDWLLIYRIEKHLEILKLVRTGTHSDLFVFA